MAVEIAWDPRQEVALMWCNTTDTAFGPVFSGPSAGTEAQEFLDWLKHNNAPTEFGAYPIIGDGCDPRDYSPTDLERLVRYWSDLPTMERT